MHSGSRRNNSNSNNNGNRPYQLKSNKRITGDRSPQHQIMNEYDEGRSSLDLESNFVNSASHNSVDQSILLNNNTSKESSTTASSATAVDKNIISPPTPSKKRKVYADVVNPLSDRYENVFCVRKGDYSCIYFVLDKVTKQVRSKFSVACSTWMLIVRSYPSRK
jgi:hypothetical protein